MSTEAHESDDDARPGPGGSDRDDAAVEPYVFDAELVDDDEPADVEPAGEAESPRKLIVARERTVAVITTLGGSGPVAATGRGLRTGLRASWTAGQGLASWADRLWLGATHGRIRRQVRTAELEGNREALAEWTDRLRAERDARVQRLMALPGEVLAALQVACLVAVALGVLLFAVGVGAWIAPDGMTWSSWWGGVGAVLLALGELVSWLALAALVVGPAALAVAAWREGGRAGTPPVWLLTPEQRARSGVEVDESLIMNALRNLNHAALNKKIKEGWGDSVAPAWVQPPLPVSHGWEFALRLPGGVPATSINARKEVFAHNLGRRPGEVWVEVDDSDPMAMKCLVLDPGALRLPVPEYPLLDEGQTDFWTGFPVGIDARFGPVVTPAFERNFVIAGVMGSGKSTLLVDLLAGAVLDPVVDIDVFCFAENNDYEWLRPVASRISMGDTAENVQACRDYIDELRESLTVRGRLLRERGIDSVTRAAAEKDERLRPRLVVIDECQSFFRQDRAEDRREVVNLMVRFYSAARKYGIVLAFATPTPSDQSLPRDLVAVTSNRSCFAINDRMRNNVVLGEKAHENGLSALGLKPAVKKAGEIVALNDVGTSISVGFSERDGLLRSYNLTGPQRAEIARRGVELRGGRMRRAEPAAALDAPVDHLADLLDALRGEARVRTTVVLSRLAEADPREYEGWSSRQLSAALLAHGVPVRKLGGGQRVVCLDDVHRAVSERDTEPHDDLP